MRQQKLPGMTQHHMAGAIACGQDSACGSPRLSGDPQDGAAPDMAPNRNCTWCLSDLLTRPMARRACRPAIGRLRSPSTSDCVTLGPLGIPHHGMRSPFAADPDACGPAAGGCRRRHPLPHACLRTSGRILPHSLEWLGRSQFLRASTIRDSLYSPHV